MRPSPSADISLDRDVPRPALPPVSGGTVGTTSASAALRDVGFDRRLFARSRKLFGSGHVPECLFGGACPDVNCSERPFSPVLRRTRTGSAVSVAWVAIVVHGSSKSSTTSLSDFSLRTSRFNHSEKPVGGDVGHGPPSWRRVLTTVSATSSPTEAQSGCGSDRGREEHLARADAPLSPAGRSSVEAHADFGG